MEPNLTYVYPHTRVQSLVSILRTTVYHAFPVVTENRQNERDFMKGNILVSNNVHYKVAPAGGSASLPGQQVVLLFSFHANTKALLSLLLLCWSRSPA